MYGSIIHHKLHLRITQINRKRNRTFTYTKPLTTYKEFRIYQKQLSYLTTDAIRKYLKQQDVMKNTQIVTKQCIPALLKK